MTAVQLDGDGLKSHGSYCSGYIPNCTSLVPGLHQPQTYVGQVYCYFSTMALRQNREEEVCQSI